MQTVNIEKLSTPVPSTTDRGLWANAFHHWFHFSYCGGQGKSERREWKGEERKGRRFYGYCQTHKLKTIANADYACTQLCCAAHVYHG